MEPMQVSAQEGRPTVSAMPPPPQFGPLPSPPPRPAPPHCQPSAAPGKASGPYAELATVPEPPFPLVEVRVSCEVRGSARPLRGACACACVGLAVLVAYKVWEGCVTCGMQWCAPQGKWAAPCQLALVCGCVGEGVGVFLVGAGDLFGGTSQRAACRGGGLQRNCSGFSERAQTALRHCTPCRASLVGSATAAAPCNLDSATAAAPWNLDSATAAAPWNLDSATAVAPHSLSSAIVLGSPSQP